MTTLNAKTWNPDRMDPTRTGQLRRAMLADLRRRFREVKRRIVELVHANDAFGLTENNDGRHHQNSSDNDSRGGGDLRPAGQTGVLNADPRFHFMATPEQLKAFQAWLTKLLQSEVLGRTEDDLWKRYTEEAMKKGAGRSWTDVRQKQLVKERPDLFTPDKQDSLRDFYEGSREEFLRSAFSRPVGVEKLKVLAARTFTDLKGVTDSMIPKLSRTLLDGMASGEHPRTVARDLSRVIDISLPRAETIARTEISRAYVEGQLDAMEQMGVERLGVMVEWSTAGDSHVCELCLPLEGVVLKIDEAKGMFPRHPNAVFAGSTFMPYGDCLEMVRAKYSGPCIVLYTSGAGKDRATIGPNHPMMTRRGMVKAAEIVVGDEILYDLRGDFSFPTLGVQHKQVPLVEDACESMFSVRESSVITSSGSDLHGDRVFCHGEVQAVRPARGLLKLLDPCGIQQLLELNLTRADVQEHGMSRVGSGGLHGVRINLASSGRLRRRHLKTAFVGTHSGPFDQFGFGSSSEFDSETFQPETDRSGGYPETIGKILGGLSGQIALPDFFIWKRVHKVSVDRYVGWAFDASTHYSLYCSGGFVVSNCRCALLPAQVGEDEDELDQFGNKRKTTAAQVKRSISKSVKEEGGEDRTTWAGADKRISKQRPEYILSQR